jgi:glutathione S-transferase
MYMRDFESQAIVDASKSLALGESGAVMQYLSEAYGSAAPEFYPGDPIKRARINFWLHWHHDNSRLATTKILRFVLRAKLFPKIVQKVPLDEVLNEG